MAIGACVPFAVVLSRVDREIEPVVVPVCRDPCRLRMAVGTGCRELGCSMWRVIRLVIIILMASDTGIGRGIVIAVMAHCAIIGNCHMGAGQDVVIVVDRECGRGPVRVGRMALITSGWNIDRRMVRVGGGVVIGLVASCTGIWGVDIISLVARGTVVPDRSMGASQRIVVPMDREGRRLPAGVGGVALIAGVWDADRQMVRVCRLIISRSMTLGTDRRGILVPAYMALVARRRGMGAGERVECIVVEPSFCTSGRMAGITSRTAVEITAYLLMLVIRFGLVIVRMTADAGVFRIIGRIRMTIRTLVPHRTVVFSGVDREIGIMSCELGGFPSRVCCMAISAGGRKAKRNVRRIGCRYIVCLMAGIAVGRCVRIIPVDVAFVAIHA